VGKKGFFFGIVCGVVMGFAGCSVFPRLGAHTKIQGEGQEIKAWKIKSTDRYDYFQYLNKEGKIVALGFDDNRDGRAEVRIDFAAMGTEGGSPHYVILLDGVPYQTEHTGECIPVQYGPGV
jgi:hypothetical protein